ncbi:type II toxin-antitoxin system ParD family antitoxin [Paraburkholderia mimosarum]|uniref:type II toxin-antitoxin system ParD family antitoxin n=1 Tax=Paraburkholderia mimosarum TaxID=312026 RepID=UPI000412D6FC|nr:type II toxin-antitoxin system ParD family antitoxin [Paraburkholderia mimosarum]
MASERLTITLTPELLEFVRERTAEGDYNSDSEVVRDGLRLLKERDNAVRQWLAEKVVPGYLQYKANPESAMTREQIEQQLDRDRSQRRAKKRAAG